ncbi:hypothetical protein CBA19CS22_13890 [Caballeronia novacaledonica]|uniref:Uncharacterized protein n=1 Tax=Caballeronia novacaledonica TaxID=1544861 RepID=A0ACB5QSE2_9BURK|nr:hypothetical protein CBA19CS22_13890 [Caballeronia novacaledonica]
MRFDGRGNDIVLGGAAALRAGLLGFLVDGSGLHRRLWQHAPTDRSMSRLQRTWCSHKLCSKIERYDNADLWAALAHTSRRLNDLRGLASLSQMNELVDRGAQEIQ